MSHISTVSTTSSSIAPTGVAPAASSTSAYKAVQYRYPVRPAYEAGYDELDSYAVDSRGEVRIVRPRLAISAERGFRRGF